MEGKDSVEVWRVSKDSGEVGRVSRDLEVWRVKTV